MPTIPRKLPNSSLEDWNKNKPTPHMAREHLERVIRCAPASWQAAVRERLAPVAPPMLAVNKTDHEWLQEQPEWAQAWDMLQAIAQYEDRFGAASLWNLDDFDICEMAKKLAGEADELDALASSLIATLNSVTADGSAVPAPESLTGTTRLSSSDVLAATGSVRIALVDEDGVERHALLSAQLRKRGVGVTGDDAAPAAAMLENVTPCPIKAATAVACALRPDTMTRPPENAAAAVGATDQAPMPRRSP